MGGVVNSLFGGGMESPDLEQSAPAPIRESTEPVSSAVRDTERRRLMARKALNGTLLTGAAGGKSASTLLGRNGNE